MDARPIEMAMIERLLRPQHGLLLMVRDRGRNAAIDESPEPREQEKRLPQQGWRRSWL
jgi:hypothetical protein